MCITEVYFGGNSGGSGVITRYFSPYPQRN